MGRFSRIAKAEAAKYQHQIHKDSRHKYNFNCGSGSKGNKGFQPGNTCGGDGDGKNDAGDQGGGDKPKGYEGSDRQKMANILTDEHGVIFGEQDDTLVMNLLKKHDGDIDKAVEEFVDKYGHRVGAREKRDEETRRKVAKNLSDPSIAQEKYGDFTEEEVSSSLERGILTEQQADQIREIAGLVEEYGQDSIDHDSIDRERLREILIRDEGLTFPGEDAVAPEAQSDEETDWDSVQTRGQYEGVYPKGYKVDHAGVGPNPWTVTDPSGVEYSFADESNAEVAAIALGLHDDGQLQSAIAGDNPEAFAAFVVDHNGEYRDTTADTINDLSSRFEDAYIGRYDGGIVEYAQEYITDIGGPSQVQNASFYADYTKWNTELSNVDEGMGVRESGDGYEVYDRQDPDVEPTQYDSRYEAEKDAEEMNNEILDMLMSDAASTHPGSGESYSRRYFDFESFARDLEMGGDVIDLGDGNLIFGNY